MFTRKFTRCMDCKCWQMQAIASRAGSNEDLSGECRRRAPTLLYIQAHEDDRDGGCAAQDEQGIWPSTFGGEGCFDGISLGWAVRVRHWIHSWIGERKAFNPRAKLVDRVWSSDSHQLNCLR